MNFSPSSDNVVNEHIPIPSGSAKRAPGAEFEAKTVVAKEERGRRRAKKRAEKPEKTGPMASKIDITCIGSLPFGGNSTLASPS
jgi:hypothetical protein